MPSDAASRVPGAGTKKDVRLSEVFDKRLACAMRNLDTYRPRWADMYRDYRAWRTRWDPEKADWQTDIKIPYLFQTVETIVPRMVDPNPSFLFLPVTPRDRQNADSVRIVVNNQLSRDGFVTKQVPFLKPSAVFGLSWAKNTWKYDVRKRTRRPTAFSMQPGSPNTIVTDEIYYDDPSTSIPSVFRVAWDPAGERLDEMEYVFHEMYVSKAHLRRNELRKLKDGRTVGVYENVDEALARGPGAERFDAAMPNRTAEEEDAERGNEQVRLVEMWVPSENRLVAKANGVIVRNQEYPYDHGRFPFCAITMQPDIYKFAGISEVEPLSPIQRYLHEILQQKIDNARLAMDIVLLYRNTVENPDDLVIAPGEKWGLDDPDRDVRAFQLPDTQLAGEREIQMLKGDLQGVSGVSPYLSGADAGSSGVNQETATGLLAIQQESNKRMATRLMQVRAQGWEEIASQYHELNEQFITDVRAVRISDEDFQHYVPDGLRGRFDVTSKWTSDEISRQIRQRQLQELAAALRPYADVPLPNGMRFSWLALLNGIAQAYDFELQELMMPEPPPPPAPPAPPPAPPAPPRVNINFKDLGPGDQVAAAQEAGLPGQANQQAPAAANAQVASRMSNMMRQGNGNGAVPTGA